MGRQVSTIGIADRDGERRLAEVSPKGWGRSRTMLDLPRKLS